MINLYSKKLLVCIAFHYNENRIGYLETVLNEFRKYKMQVDIIIDTNTAHVAELNCIKDYNDVIVVTHSNLEHPYHLTACHRSHMLKHLNDYDWFYYTEDDMMLPYENFNSFVKQFDSVWPDYIPGFVRVENHLHNEFLEKCTPDIMDPITSDMIVNINNKSYIRMLYHYNYHAFWILPKTALRESILKIGEDKFLSIPEFAEVREHLASFAIWTLNIPSVLAINENKQLDSRCISYHLPNNYGTSAKLLNSIFNLTSNDFY